MAPAGQFSGYHDALHLVTQESSNDSFLRRSTSPFPSPNPGVFLRRDVANPTPTTIVGAGPRTGPDPLRSRSLESALRLPARRSLRLRRSAYHQRLLPYRELPGGFRTWWARICSGLGRPSRQYPPDAPGGPVQPPHAQLGQEAWDSGDRLPHRRTEARESANSTCPPIPPARGSSVSWSTAPRPPSGTCNATATTGSTCTARSHTLTSIITSFISGIPIGGM